MIEALMALWEIFIGGLPIFIFLFIFFALVCYGISLLRLFFKI